MTTLRLLFVLVGSATLVAACGDASVATQRQATFADGQTAAHVLQPKDDRTLCVYATLPDSGTVVQLAKCDGSAGQNWVRNEDSLQVFEKECLTVAEDAQGTHVEIMTCDADKAAQHWIFSVDGRVRWSTSGKCLESEGDAPALGAPLQLAECDVSHVTQNWLLH